MQNEILWVTYIENNEPTYFITSDKIREVYKLYDLNKKLISTNKSPMELEKFIYTSGQQSLF